MNPKVSILVATYNGEKYLRKQLDSIINQTYENIEIIIQDDGSTDGTFRILQEYAADDPRIHAIQNKSNLGILKNFYSLISKCDGEYIAISDQDDIWEINKIEILLSNIASSSLIYTGSALMGDDDSLWGTTLLEKIGIAPKSGKFLSNLPAENTISGHACLFRSDLKDTILKCSQMLEHKDMMYDQLIGSIASFNHGVIYYDQPLTRHRIHANNNNNFFKKEESPKKTASSPKNTHTKQSLFERKKARTRKKIRRSYQNLVQLEMMFRTYPIISTQKNPFDLEPDPKIKFNTCFFNRKLYHALLKEGMKRAEAKELSRGKLYYIFLKIF